MLQLVWVTDAQYMGGYKIAVTFNDGKSKTVDLESHLTGQMLSPLKDLNESRTIHISHPGKSGKFQNIGLLPATEGAEGLNLQA